MIFAQRNLYSRSTPKGSLIEIDVSWLRSWTQFLDANYAGKPQPNLAGFSVYRREDQAPILSDRYMLDFVRDPYLMFYGDTDSNLTVGRRYYYGVTAISTSYLNEDNNFRPNAESAMSDTVYAEPIGQIKEVSPSNGTTTTIRDVNFTWERLSGASSYQVILYKSFPVVNASGGDIPDDIPFYWQSAVVSGTSVTCPATEFISGKTYY